MNKIETLFYLTGLMLVFNTHKLAGQTYELIRIYWTMYNGVDECLVVSDDKRGYIYEKWSAGVVFFSENLKRYPLFLDFLAKEATYHKIAKIHKDFVKIKPTRENCVDCVAFHFSKKEKGKQEMVGFIIDMSKVKEKNATIKKISDFIKNFGTERGCPQTYEIYQLKKGETLEKVAARINMDWEFLSIYNFENKIGFCTLNKFREDEDCYTIEPTEGHYIMIPCIPKK